MGSAYEGLLNAGFRIPPTQLVDCSYPAYTKEAAAARPESHQRSWWIGHTQPNSAVGFTLRLIKVRLDMNNPPTALVGFRTRAQCLLRRPIVNDPPTALVGFELNAHTSSPFSAASRKRKLMLELLTWNSELGTLNPEP
jgi:hypothetical protein